MADDIAMKDVAAADSLSAFVSPAGHRFKT
jgi:hypothetical protein